MITVLAEPDCYSSLPELSDSSGKGAVGHEPLLAQLLVPGKLFGMPGSKALKT
ncbi:MAG TPA: hypothetical protein VKU77_06250 [Streptosporangiaceae bacterium]|nr:hypothetical protein [Streptosporangiaceae bacterium]